MSRPTVLLVLATSLLLLVPSASWANRAPVVWNVQAQQRAGTMLVDVTYDVHDADGDVMTVSLQMSDDGGRTWRAPVSSVEGDEGAGVTSGSGKHMVWDAGADVPDRHGTNWRPKVTADDGHGTSGAVRASTH